jgi:KDO2-lipid IV(A) lauroyltransferase
VASYIPLRPAWLNRILDKRIRAVDGRPYGVDARTPREFLRLLDSKKLVCLLADQDSRIPSALEGEFMHRPVRNNPLPDFLLRHRPETPVFICWLEDARGSLRVLHAIELLRASAPCGVMPAFNIWLESRIKENPALWYGWTHRRFYSRNPEIYARKSPRMENSA